MLAHVLLPAWCATAGLPAAGAVSAPASALAGPAAGGMVWAQVQDWMRQLHGVLGQASVQPTAASLALAALLVTALPMAAVVPMTLVCLAVAAALPPWSAAGVILAGVAANTTLSWVLARSVFGARIERWLERQGGLLGSVRDGARSAPLKWAFIARYVPAPFIAAPMVLSTTGVGLGTTLVGSLLGMLPWTGVYLYVAHAGKESSLPGIARALSALVCTYAVVGLLRKRLLKRPAPPGPLTPRRPGTPVVRLYTLEGDPLSLDARRELAGLRDALGFEVEEVPLDPSSGGEDARFRDHAPVALLGAERLFNYKMDEHVLRERLKRLPPDGERT